MSAAEPSGKRREAALRALVAEHFDFIWRLLRRRGFSPEDADDATQQVFMTALAKLDRINQGSERTFLYGVALRVSANARRKLARRREDALGPELAEEDPQGSPERAVELAQARTKLDATLARMPAELARVLVLAEIERLPASEIALLEGIPAGTVASRLRRARLLFRELLTSDEPAPPEEKP